MAAAAPVDLRARFDAAPMSGTQVAAVAVTVALSALDGFDVLSVTFAAPAIARDWGVGKAALGVLLSAGLGGMALGSLVLAPFADVVGRRRMVLVSLVLMAAGMLLSAWAQSVPQLTALRVVTGLGIGAMVVVINPLAAEFANAQRRSLALALMAVGYPLGGLIGGVVSAILLKWHGWPAIFLAGAGAAAVLVPVVLRFLPESLAFLLARPRRDSLVRVNALLARCGLDAVSALPAAAASDSVGYVAVFARGQRAATIRVTIANLLFVMAVYYVLSWMPQMVAESGFPPSTASLVAAVANLAGIAGGVMLGWLARRAGVNRLTVGMMMGLGAATIALGLVPPSLPLLVATAAVCGFFLFGGVTGLYATFALTFTTEARASGTGFVIGVGRIASAVAPLLGGWLFASGFGRGAVSAAFGACALLAAMVLLLRPRAARPAATPLAA